MIKKTIFLTATTIFLTGTSGYSVAAETELSNAPYSGGTSTKSSSQNPHSARSTDTRSDTETVIVTGTHTSNRKARQSTSPITVITAAELRRSGQLNLADALTRTYASINMPAMGNDAGALTAAIRMRGLNPNQVLVLVDGKRRHTTANIYADAGPAFGATPVDVNMLPAASIDHIEVLEDGAAALYGSDALAGVVNIITQKTNHGLNVRGQTGANAYNGDGWQYQTSFDGGIQLLRDGYLHMSGQVYHTDHMVPYTEDHRLLGYAPPGAGTTLYNGSVKVPKNSNKVMSTPEETRENFSIALGKPITPDIDAYSLITYAHRHAESYQNYRPPNTMPTYSPSGFSPLKTIEENDYAATLGIKGKALFGFTWDLSTTYGADEDRISNKNSVNLGMVSKNCLPRSQFPNSTSAYLSTEGCGWSPTTTRSESYRMAQWTNALDFKRTLHTGFATPTTIAFGAEHRLDTYEIVAGTPPSYEAGGMSGYVGLSPQNAGRWNRDIWAGYMDNDFHPLPHWDVDLAGRFEHYTDVGNTENGKISTRYDITPRLAVRGTISNGFRAPTLAEQHFSAINVGATTVSGLLPVGSQAARTLGAAPLKPERSTNASAGVVIEPLTGLHVEADVYQINIRDRIIAGGSNNGPVAITALQQLGFVLPTGLDPNAISTYFFANGASTRTQGADLKASYLLHLPRYGTVNLSAALDLNRTRLSHVSTTTANGRSVPLLNAATASYITTAYPRSKLILNAYWTLGQWDVNLRQTRYGETTTMLGYQDWTPSSARCGAGGALRYSSTCFAQFKNTPRWLTDLEVGYAFMPHWHLAVGANNIFNIRPRRVNPFNNNYGARIYDANSAQAPITGGYYYGRIDASF